MSNVERKTQPLGTGYPPAAGHPILCLGTTPAVQRTMIFDRLILDEVNRAVEVRRNASGKPINVARVLRALGDEATACVPVGGDAGRFIREDLASAKIAARCVEVRSLTRTCVTLIDRAGHTATELVEEHGPLTAIESKQMLAALRTLIGRAKVLVLSGSLAAGVGDDFYAQCCQAANEAGVKIILDARGEPLKRALPFKPLIVKPNRAELSATVGLPANDDKSLRRAMQALCDHGPAWVITTLGKDGAMATDGKNFWRIPPLEIEVISPIGSGDAFAAGLASAIAAGQSVPDACRLATACAAANAMVVGAGFLDMVDVRRLEKQVRVERI